MTRRPLQTGWCFLCRQNGVLVVFIGPVESGGGQAPVFACEPCCQFARDYVQQYATQWDARPAS
jgi:hypothetical protein